MVQVDTIPVEHVDRIAAADLLDEISSLLDHNGIGQVADLVRDGEYDEHEATLAFARHRLRARTEADRSVREALEARADACRARAEKLAHIRSRQAAAEAYAQEAAFREAAATVRAALTGSNPAVNGSKG